eukprot:gene3825-4176_t
MSSNVSLESSLRSNLKSRGGSEAKKGNTNVSFADSTSSGVSGTSGSKASPSKVSPSKASSTTTKSKSRSSSRSPSPDTKGASQRPNSRGRSPSPTKVFSEDDFERKRDVPDAEKRKKMAAAKARGLAIDPKDWSRAELMDRLNRFAKFSQDKVAGTCSLKIKTGFALSTEEVKVICELCKRINELQVIDMVNSGVTDDHLQIIVNEGFKELRHLKELYLNQNQLTSSSITTLCGHFPKLYRKLEVLDLRENSAMSYDDGHRIYTAMNGIHFLNGLDIALLKSDEETRTTFDFSNKDVRIMEVGIICGLIGHMSRVQSIILRNNMITAKGAHYLIDIIKKYPRVKSIDLSYNPVTNEMTDVSAVERLRNVVQKGTHLLDVRLDGVPMDESLRQGIELSLQVNRSVEGTRDGYHFTRFVEDLIASKAKPKVRSAIESWEPTLDEVDESFVRSNRLPIGLLKVSDSGFGMIWKSQPKEEFTT